MTPPRPIGRIAVAAISGLVAVLPGCGSGGGGSAAADRPLAIADAWARTTPPGTTVGAVYLRATSETGDVLVGAAVDDEVAASATLHTTMTSDSGETSMDDIDSFDVPADGALVFEPAGNHVMLVDLVGALERGDTFELTLRFETAGDVTVTVEVRDDAP